MSIQDDDYTSYEMTGNNPNEDVAGSYQLLMEIIKLLNRIHEENNIITDIEIKFHTKRDFEHTTAISYIPLTVNTKKSVKSNEEIYNSLNELMERWFNLPGITLNNFMYKNFVMEFAATCKSHAKKILVGAGMNDGLLYVESVNKILKEYKVPFCVHENLKGVQFVILRTTWEDD